MISQLAKYPRRRLLFLLLKPDDHFFFQNLEFFSIESRTLEYFLDQLQYRDKILSGGEDASTGPCYSTTD